MPRRSTVVADKEEYDHIKVVPVAQQDANGPVAKWLRSLWRPIAALVYLSLQPCLVFRS